MLKKCGLCVEFLFLEKSLADSYDEDADEYYFDRHLPSFPAILYFYQTGYIWRPLDVPMGRDLY